jgi:thymidylate synthase (FAD)
VKIGVLDYGYVEFIEAWGTGKERHRIDYEVGIVEAARQSTQGSFRGWDQDEKLLSYLYKNNHSTPFEFAGMVIEVQAPLFIFREWHRHRTQSYNEMSARYAPLPALDYIPDGDRLMMGTGTNKQAGAVAGAEELTWERAEKFKLALLRHYRDTEELYQNSLEYGIPKELARLVLPVGRYSKMRASANLRNWLAFMTLRSDPKAQWEIQQYANAVGSIIQERFPQTFKLWQDNRGN